MNANRASVKISRLPPCASIVVAHAANLQTNCLYRTLDGRAGQGGTLSGAVGAAITMRRSRQPPSRNAPCATTDTWFSSKFFQRLRAASIVGTPHDTVPRVQQCSDGLGNTGPRSTVAGALLTLCSRDINPRYQAIGTPTEPIIPQRASLALASLTAPARCNDAGRTIQYP